MELRPLSEYDASELRRILATPDVARWWDHDGLLMELLAGEQR